MSSRPLTTCGPFDPEAPTRVSSSALLFSYTLLRVSGKTGINPQLAKHLTTIESELRQRNLLEVCHAMLEDDVRHGRDMTQPPPRQVPNFNPQLVPTEQLINLYKVLGERLAAALTQGDGMRCEVIMVQLEQVVWEVDRRGLWSLLERQSDQARHQGRGQGAN